MEVQRHVLKWLSRLGIAEKAWELLSFIARHVVTLVRPESLWVVYGYRPSFLDQMWYLLSRCGISVDSSVKI